MDIYSIDYISVLGRSWLHRVPTGIKLFGVALIIGVLLYRQSILLEAIVLAVVLAAALSARLPMRMFLGITLYPLVFLVIVFLSIRGLTLNIALTFALRVLAITASVVTLFMSTSYPAIFKTLGRVLPGFLVTALFFTYRSLFVIADSLNNIRTAMHLRGGVNWKHPISTLRNFGMALGHFLVHTIESSERMADSLKIRGFSNRIYYVSRRQ